MNTRSSNWTGRVPRDVQSAFGPYTSRQVSEPEGRTHPAEVVMYVVLVPIFAAFLVAVAFGWIA